MTTLSPHANGGAYSAGPAAEASGFSTESSRNTTIANEKKARKAVEEDAARLHSRVTTLQKEEQKAQKRLEETRLKAKDLLELRAQNERRQLEREQRHEQLQVGQKFLALQQHMMSSSSILLAGNLLIRHCAPVERACCSAARLWLSKREELLKEGQGREASIHGQDDVSRADKRGKAGKRAEASRVQADPQVERFGEEG